MTGRGTAVIFGAGSIGRGFMGQILHEAGLELVFVEANAALVDELNRARRYPLLLVGPTRHERLEIDGVRAVSAMNVDAVAQELSHCEVACSAVGVRILPRIAPAVALGAARRRDEGDRPLNLILCENQLHSSKILRDAVMAQKHPPVLDHFGLVESVIGRMVPLPDPSRGGDPLEVRAEDYMKLPLDAAAIRGELPVHPAFRPVSPFEPWVERKLFLTNMGHATAAYVGDLFGCNTIAEAMQVEAVASVVRTAMEAASAALSMAHAFPLPELLDETKDLLIRFANPGLEDTVSRVGRDPGRKLGREDRLIGAAFLCLKSGQNPAPVCVGIAAALRFETSGPKRPALEAFEALAGYPAPAELSEAILQADHVVDGLQPG